MHGAAIFEIPDHGDADAIEVFADAQFFLNGVQIKQGLGGMFERARRRH